MLGVALSLRGAFLILTFPFALPVFPTIIHEAFWEKPVTQTGTETGTLKSKTPRNDRQTFIQCVFYPHG